MFKSSFDLFVHLPNELPLARDGHRRVNELFRSASDRLLKQTYDELKIDYVIVGGSLEQRCAQIIALTGRSPVMSVAAAISKGSAQYATLIM
jgi:nicotinamide riboside kinase